MLVKMNRLLDGCKLVSENFPPLRTQNMIVVVVKFQVRGYKIMYRGSPTSTVSTSAISTSTNFCAIGIKFVLVESLCSKIRTSENWLCSTH